jgi:Tol biopolymer transport system component
MWDAATGKSTTVISQTEQIPGIVDWSPNGDSIAYAAVPARETGEEWMDLMTFDNPAIAGRRIYLLDPATGESRRLNEAGAFQDGPLWSNDGTILYYGQYKDDQLVLMATDPATSQTETVPNAAIPLPEFIGYYGQWQQDFLLEYRFQEWKPGCP